MTENKKIKKQQILRDFSLRLSNALDSANYPGRGRQSLLANQMGVSQNTVFNWLSGVNLPSPIKQRKLSLLLGVSLDWLVNGSGEMDGDVGCSLVPMMHMTSIPSYVDEDYQCSDTVDLAKCLVGHNNLVAFKQAGDWMANTDTDSIPLGATVFINLDRVDLYPEVCYLVKFAGYPEPIVRKAKASDTGKIVFIALNRNYDEKLHFNELSDKVYGAVEFVILGGQISL